LVFSYKGLKCWQRKNGCCGVERLGRNQIEVWGEGGEKNEVSFGTLTSKTEEITTEEGKKKKREKKEKK